jgi:IS5 family transposase
MLTDDFFRARIDAMINLNDPLAVLARRLPWAQLEALLAAKFERQERAGEIFESHDMFGATRIVEGAGISNAGRPKLPLRLMVSLAYLKHSFNLSDEELVVRWSENVLWQFFSGLDYYEHRLPCDATQIGRFRRDLGEDGMELLLKATIDAALAMKAVKPRDLERVIVDTTVQEKAIAHPVDSRLLEIARHKVVSAAKRAGIQLKQTFAKEGKELRRRAGGYAHAKQFKRLRKVVKRQRTILGIVIREVLRKGDAPDFAPEHPTAVSELLMWIERAERIRTQQRHDKDKLYALHAPEVECIGKVRREVAYIIVSPAHKAGDETGRSVGRSLPVHASLAMTACEATGTTRRAFGPRRPPRGGGVTCQHHGGWGARLSGMVNRCELLQASLCTTSQRC